MIDTLENDGSGTQPRASGIAALKKHTVTQAHATYMIVWFFLTARENATQYRWMSPLWEMVQEGIDLRTVNWTGH